MYSHSSRKGTKRRQRVVGWSVACLAALLATSAAPAAASTKAAASGPLSPNTVVVSADWAELWNCSFNPFTQVNTGITFGTIYEPLMFVDELTSKVSPWLATSYTWSKGNTQLTFVIRSGVHWSSGQPFSAADVVFTFDMLKKYPSLDLNGIWPVLKSVAQTGSNKVTFTFKSPEASYFFYVADQVPIVPANIWSKVPNPTTYADRDPIGTGAYVLKACNPENLTETANPHYWQPGLPKITTVQVPAFTANAPSNELLSAGKANWGGEYIPNLQSLYLSKSSYNHSWQPVLSAFYVAINLKNSLLSNLAVRKALVFALDLPKIALQGEQGQVEGQNQEGIPVPTYSSWIDQAEVSKYNYHYDPSEAIKILEQAGFKRNGSGVFRSPSGQTLSFTCIETEGETNGIANEQEMIQQWQAVGIQVTAEQMSASAELSDVQLGNYQLAWAPPNFTGSTPFYTIAPMLNSAQSAPIGKTAVSDYARYDSPSTDADIVAYGNATSLAQQRKIVDELQQVMLQDVPYIPVVGNPDWDQYSNQQVVGWPTPQDPYAQPSPWIYPDWGMVLLHLTARH
jgi:peptide/nickel transport system substrate-binding protein